MANPRLCSIPDCGKPRKRREWCDVHYMRWYHYRDPYTDRTRVKPTCSIPGCGKPHSGRGYCNMHLKRLRTHGDPLGGPTSPGEPMRYFHETVLTYEGDDCLPWPYTRRNGYARLSVNGKQRTVSRMVCEEANGPPPTPRHEAAHLCGNGHEGCVAKKHLSWKTPVENWADRYVHGTASSCRRDAA